MKMSRSNSRPCINAVMAASIIGGGPHRYTYRSGYFPVPLNHVDISPTSLGLCGLDVPDWMMGTDYSGYRIRERTVVNEPDSRNALATNRWIELGNVVHQPSRHRRDN